MRKILIAALAASALVPALAPVAASATSRLEVRHDQREVKRDRHEVRRDVKAGDHQEAKHDRQETREDRRELKEDWRSYRSTHRSVYQRGRYTAPPGLYYRSINPGYRLTPAFYEKRYWISDYNTYRLPNPGLGHRWVRYGNDVVLIDTRSGVAIQILRAFFL